MALESSIEEVTMDNLEAYPQAICFINPKHPHFHKKVQWLGAQFKRGLKIKLQYVEGLKRPVGFIEYVPGEHCWRAVSAKGYMFIHCLWTNGKKYQGKGLGAQLLKEAEKDAKGMLGMAAIASEKAFMANSSVFLKNGFDVQGVSGKEQLLVKQFKKGPAPSMNDWESQLKKRKGLCIVYSRQCPWVARFVEEVQPILKENDLEIKMTELKTPAQAQKAPSLYGAFSLIRDGKLLADRYVSTTRFLNILKKEKLTKAG